MAIEENPFDHILYEFSMYLQTSMFRSNDQFITNLMVDSRMVHMRNLAYFFSSDKDRNKSYLHYAMFVSKGVLQEIEHDLFAEIQRVTSNATCHLLKGRMKESFKQETIVFEQSVFPILVAKIKRFLMELNTNVLADYTSQWAEKQIQNNAAGILDLIRKYEATEFDNPVGTTSW